MKYRAIQNVDKENNRYEWLIQRKQFFTGKWVFQSGFYVSKEEAEECIRNKEFYHDVHSYPASVWVSHNHGIEIDGFITDSGKYQIKNYFKKGALKVIRIDYAPMCYGGARVYAVYE